MIRNANTTAADRPQRRTPGGGKHGLAVESGSMIRRMFTAMEVLSLLLCVGTAILWVHSRGRWDIAYRKDERQLANATLWLLAASRGSIWVYHERYDARLRQNWGPQLDRGVGSVDEEPFELVEDPTWNTGSENEFRHRWPTWVHAGTGANPFQMLIVPMWCLLAIFTLLPAVRAGLWIRRAGRTKAGLCPACGYDLRATPDHCPECGSPIPAKC